MKADKNAVVVLALCAAAALVFVRLGLWQLERHGERQLEVREYSERVGAAPVPLTDLRGRDSAALYTHVTVQGEYDFANEVLLINRTRRGAPGVNVVTPLIVSGGDSIVFVNRGWVYSPDGTTIEALKWRDSVPMRDSILRSQSVSLTGLVIPFPDSGARVHMQRINAASRSADFSWHEVKSISGSPNIYPFYVQLLPADTLVRPGVPVPLPSPSLSAGPHMSYAFQWFAFAAIAIVGGIVLLYRTGKQDSILRNMGPGFGRGDTRCG